MNDIATYFLQTYAAGAEVDEGWLYGKALQQARLDYSPESLARLDTLLAQIRERAKPTRAHLDSPKGRNFASLVAFYVVEIVRRLSRADIAWLDRASALRLLPPGTQIPDAPAARLVANALDQAMAFQPLAWIEAQVLPGGQQAKAGDYIASLVARLERDGPADWWNVAHALGYLASSQMMMAANALPVWPRMVSQADPTTLLDMPHGDIRKALELGDRLMTTNPDNSAWRVLSYAGYSEQDGVRLDALILLAATYGERPARMKLAFPFIPAGDGRPFAILRPALKEANLTVETVGKLNGALERGIRDHTWLYAGSWNEYYRG